MLYDLYLKNNNKLDGKLIFDALEQNCETAQKVFDEYIEWLVIGLKNLINIFGPDAIILAGGITQRGSILIDAVRNALDTPVKIEISKLQNDAGALGAAML